jgi:hypothetical protein
VHEKNSLWVKIWGDPYADFRDVDIILSLECGVRRRFGFFG